MKGLKGKGFYIWDLTKCGEGDPEIIAWKAKDAGINHVIIKIADGVRAFNLDEKTGADLVKPVVIALQKLGITVWGWHYIYGYSPLKEAQISISRIMQTGVTGFVANAEQEFKTRYDDDDRATLYMTTLRAGLPSQFEIALSTYRRPDYHPEFPFTSFLKYCDYNMPQVYWLLAHDPVTQLLRCIEEYSKLSVIRPMIPTGSAWATAKWTATPSDVTSFLGKVKSLGLEGASFWSWQHTERLNSLWEAISDFDWPVEQEEPDPIIIEPEDDMDLEKVRTLLTEFPEAQLVINIHMDITEESLEEEPQPVPPTPLPPSNEVRYKVNTTGKTNKQVKVRPSPGGDEHDFVFDGDILYGPGKELNGHYYVTRKLGGDLIPGYVEIEWVKPY